MYWTFEVSAGVSLADDTVSHKVDWNNVKRKKKKKKKDFSGGWWVGDALFV